MNILDRMNVKDYLGLSPVYWLCNKGYKNDPEHGVTPPEHKKRHEMLKLLQEIAGTEGRSRDDTEFLYQPAPRVHFTPFHWLCYWDDNESIAFVLDNVKADPSKNEKIMAATSE